MTRPQPRKKLVSPETRQHARRLRRGSTLAEQHLWMLLRNRAVLGIKFRRQFPIGPFIADFCSPERMLVIEIDGQSHVSRDGDDASRERFIENQGYRVMRFTNEEVLTNPRGVLEVLVHALNQAPHPNPLPRGERGPVCAMQRR